MSAGKKIRVLIVDDSVFMCKVLESIVSADPEMEVAAVARDGREAITQSEGTRPDVITMDINMPKVDGLQATEVIMSTNPRPILIVSSESREGAASTLRSLELGAIDFIAKPSSAVDLDMDSIREELCRKLKLAAKVRVVRNATRATLPPGAPAAGAVATAAPANGQSAAKPAIIVPAAPAAPLSPVFAAVPSIRPNGRFPIVCVAASTGGPATLMRFVPSFPANFPGALLLIQHMPGTFSSQFVEQLAEVAATRVKEAEQGELILPGTTYLCPGSHHLRVSPTGRITLDDGPRVVGYRPCADLTMETLAAFSGAMSTAVVLTGMGSDASRGVVAIKAAGGHVIAQDESTSIIFGMPAEAIRTGAVDQVLPIEQIYPAIEKRVLYTLGAARMGGL
jgi:two-component system chemotaxis response regulator CheB